jgi:hypothetical protein
VQFAQDLSRTAQKNSRDSSEYQFKLRLFVWSALIHQSVIEIGEYGKKNGRVVWLGIHAYNIQ